MERGGEIAHVGREAYLKSGEQEEENRESILVCLF